MRQAALTENSGPLSTAEAPHPSKQSGLQSTLSYLSLDCKSGLVGRGAEPHGCRGNRPIPLRFSCLSET